ncbi:type IA DNA topoisomerase [Ornithobacterium rhinotracheale]|uniref:type IA DNA topoisomerase n=1 Tax=Ornithobacterium rhinotracheale TaxID=28251 RepID=UPI00129C70F4|nr:type IA DNA topoisomerase [Ornithobacterium rhinotracheale]MRJ11581.1 type IA DNA topoisomerase [Ornithobacterium rhinotracheale]
MKLIIAEKPSQAFDYAKALGGFKNKDGYLENNEYYITWCFGHLVELAKDTAYREGTKWDKSYLPLLPEKFQYSIGTDRKGNVDSGKRKQIHLIKDLAHKSESIINATDADREGELIFRYVYNFLNLKKPFQRLWISSLTKGDIIKGFNNLLSAQEVENLSKAGYARAIADWLIGINGTQSATLHLGNGNLLSIGRVQTAILKIICERYLKHKDFKPTYSYRLKALHENQRQGISFESTTEVFSTEQEAKDVLSKLDKTQHFFVNKESKTTKQAPPLLFSIDTLIVSCNKLFNLTGQQTLNIAQSLYERKLTTYPRTDSNYINEENFRNIKSYLPELANRLLQIDYSFEVQKPKSVNDKKLTGSHDAIVPTGNIESFATLNDTEKKVFQLIIRRCLQSFSKPAIYEKTNYNFINNEIPFTTKTSVLVDKGYKLYEERAEKQELAEDEQNVVLDYQPFDRVNVLDFDIKEIEAKPPQLYTDANLTPALTHIDKFLQEENPTLYQELKQKIDLKDVQIGTQATRPAIIERLKKLNFIKIEKKKYIPTDTGLNYYNTIKDLQVSNIANTAILEKQLKDIQEEKITENEFYQKLNDYVSNIVNDIFSLQNKTITNTKQTKKALGTCPKCKKGNIIEGKKGYGCSEWKQGCDFVIWKQIAGKKITENNVKDLIEKGITPKIKGFKSKAGKPFEAKLTLNEEYKTEFNFNF